LHQRIWIRHHDRGKNIYMWWRNDTGKMTSWKREIMEAKKVTSGQRGSSFLEYLWEKLN